MPDQEIIDFTDRERFVVTYFRSSELASYRRRWLYDGVIFVASALSLIYSFAVPDPAFAFVAYGLVVSRLFYMVVEGQKWGQDFRSIFAKYDAKVKELSQAATRHDKNKDGE